MKAEETLQYMADFYSEIFPTRKHALNHLFCVVGNGYKWVNGELVYENDRYKNRYKLCEYIERAEFPYEYLWYESHNRFHKFCKGEDEKKIPYKYQFAWYPLSKKYSKLYTYPDDIKPDWKALLEECKQLLIEDGIEI